MCRRWIGAIALACMVALGPVPAAAQVETVDPDLVIDGDLSNPQPATPPPAYEPPYEAPAPAAQPQDVPPASSPDSSQAATPSPSPSSTGETYKEDDLIGAAEGVFGKGAEGLARMIEDILSKQGEPNAYIVGREGGGALIFGARYGSGTLYHKVEGTQPVYWTGPSLGLDIGANAANTFVLVYNLFDTDDLFHRFGQGEGQAYLIGGFHISYLRKGDVVLIPVRMGAGLRLGINVGYMKFSHKQKWLPF